jgi:hypothetical protein
VISLPSAWTVAGRGAMGWRTRLARPSATIRQFELLEPSGSSPSPFTVGSDDVPRIN